ncbi:MAG: YSC84-related protein [Acetobacteraceae bacterium]
MKRILSALGFALLVLSPGVVRAQGNIQALVDRSTLTLQGMMDPDASDQALTMLQRARAVLICPRVFAAGFIVGGSGGDCVMAARAANGTWSYPAFFAIGSASVGLQLGLKDSELVMMVMTNRGLNALLESHFKFGADASAVVATVGGGVEGATTTAVGADIVAFTKSRGAFAGLSLSGSVLSARSDWDAAYYGRSVDTRAIVLQMAARNSGADPLRALLTRYGSTQPATPPAQPGGYATRPAYGQPVYTDTPVGNAPGYGQPDTGAPAPLSPSGPIRQQPLPPPR